MFKVGDNVVGIDTCPANPIKGQAFSVKHVSPCGKWVQINFGISSWPAEWFEPVSEMEKWVTQSVRKTADIAFHANVAPDPDLTRISSEAEARKSSEKTLYAGAEWRIVECDGENYKIVQTIPDPTQPYPDPEKEKELTAEEKLRAYRKSLREMIGL